MVRGPHGPGLALQSPAETTEVGVLRKGPVAGPPDMAQQAWKESAGGRGTMAEGGVQLVLARAEELMEIPSWHTQASSEGKKITSEGPGQTG